VPIPEDHPKNPTSEYGKTKLQVEEMLESLREKDSSVSFVCLRYFNASGASLDGSLGEDHIPETHIIPLAVRALLNDEEFSLFGTDYDTPDGTCIRDYIHVLDLVEAHILALNKLDQESGGFYYNVGTGSGYSNKEVLNAIEKVSNRKIKIVERERRTGDADQLIADPTKIKNELGFEPKYSDLETIIKTAWAGHSKSKAF
ncbi:MAG: UDP-glucose 4-epimerase, partial [Candidatus Levybacteria bacterium]|nr:UDP-glucose 4-epimerase [Candidatus Levybacteria bacterium]